MSRARLDRNRIFLLVVFLASSSCARLPTWMTPGSTAARTRGTSPEAKAARSIQAAAKDVSASKFILGPGDQLSISVYGEDDLRQQVQIPPDGVIYLPLVGEVKASGRGLGDLRKDLAEGLGKYLVNPQVSLAVTQIRSRKIYVLGEVNRPGVLQFDGQTDAVEAIASAGGFTLDAAQSSVVLVRRGENGRPKVRKLDMGRLFGKGDLSQNAMLQAGDLLYVPESVIADIDRFSQRLEHLLLALVRAEQGIALEPSVEVPIIGAEPTSPVSPPILVTPP
jgi:polysaccharide export outer membrane protein